MIRTAQALVILICCLPGGLALAADFDGSKPLICAPTEAGDLPSIGEARVKARPAEIGVPSFLRIDLAKKTIAGPKRTTAIRFVEQGNGQVLMQGTELGFAWTIVLDQDDGTMVGTFVDRFGVVTLIGTCTPLVA